MVQLPLSKSKAERIPTARLSSFYFFYFAFLGCLLPFWPLFLTDRGFSGYEIGLVHAVFLGTKIIAPTIWGAISDKFDIRIGIIRFGVVTAAFFFCGYLFEFDLQGLLLLSVAYSFFWNAILSQFEAYTLTVLDQKSDWYSRLRLWGSVGFIVFSLSLGAWFDWFDIGHLPVLMLLVMVSVALVSFSLSEVSFGAHSEAHLDQDKRFLSVLTSKPVYCFFAICLLLQMSHGAYYSFFSLYLEQFDYSRLEIGALWALGVIAEIFLFIYFHKIIKAKGAFFVLSASAVLTFIRWLLIAAFPTNYPIIIFAQILHAFSFASLHAVCMVYIQHFFPPHLSGRGQAVYSGFTFGLGGAVGALVSGSLWELLPSYSLFVFSSFVAVISLLFLRPLSAIEPRK